MNVKALMFGVLGMLIFGTITVAWISKDMQEIRAEERAELTKECKAAAPTAATANAAVPTGAPAAVAPSADLIKRCDKIGVTLQPTQATQIGTGTGVAPINPNVPSGPTTPLAPLAAADATGSSTAPIAGGGTAPRADVAAAAGSPAPTPKIPDAVPADAGTGTLPPRIGRTSSISMADPRGPR